MSNPTQSTSIAEDIVRDCTAIRRKLHREAELSGEERNTRDLILAEPGAMIGFAGARVIKETTKQTLPAGFQTSEFLLKHGLVDQIVSRLEMKDRLTSLFQALYTHRYQAHKGRSTPPMPVPAAAAAS